MLKVFLNKLNQTPGSRKPFIAGINLNQLFLGLTVVAFFVLVMVEVIFYATGKGLFLPVHISVAFEAGGATATLDGAKVLLDNGTVWVNFGSGSKRVLAGLLHALVFGGLAIIALKVVCDLLQTIADSRPFEENNPGRIRLLAGILAAGILAEAVWTILLKSWLEFGTDIHISEPHVISTPQWLLVPVLLIGAKAFDRGKELTNQTNEPV